MSTKLAITFVIFFLDVERHQGLYILTLERHSISKANFRELSFELQHSKKLSF